MSSPKTNRGQAGYADLVIEREFSRIVRWLIQLLDPDIPHRNLGRRTLDFDSYQPRLVVGRIRIVIHVDRHQLPVDYVDESAAPRHDQVLVPVVDLNVAPERVAIPGCLTTLDGFPALIQPPVPAKRGCQEACSPSKTARSTPIAWVSPGTRNRPAGRSSSTSTPGSSGPAAAVCATVNQPDRKSTRLNSSHLVISY